VDRSERARVPIVDLSLTVLVLQPCPEERATELEPATADLGRARDRRERGAKQAKLPKGQWIGWHALRRQWAATVLTCYQLPDPETQRAAMPRRTKFSIGGGQGAGACAIGRLIWTPAPIIRKSESPARQKNAEQDLHFRGMGLGRVELPTSR